VTLRMIDAICPTEIQHGCFPPDVEFVISALEAGPRPPFERQRLPRARYRVQARLHLYSDPPGRPATLLYTRHVNRQAIGFLTDRPLPLGHGGIVRLPSPQGRLVEIHCTVLRCREAAPGWYEGALVFNREQPDFDASEVLH